MNNLMGVFCREVTFHEINELAKKLYKLLSKMLDSVESVKFEVVLRTLVSFSPFSRFISVRGKSLLRVSFLLGV